MKNIFKKQNIMPVVVLGSICLIVAVLMAVINSYTAPKIADYEAQKVFESLKVVLDGHFEEVSVPAGAPATVTAMYKVTDDDSGDFKGNVVTVKQKGYAGDILLTIGIDAEGKTTKVVITAQSETHGKNINPLLDRLSAGVTAENVADVEAVSGATVSSTAIKSAIADALKAVSGIASEPEPEVLPTSEEQILAYAAEMIGEGAEFTNVTPDEREFVKRIYREKNGKGYIAYLVVMSRYGTVETETIIHVENNGKIKDIKKLIWKTSDAMYGYVPPEADVVDAFYASLKGKGVSELEELAALEEGNHNGLLVTQGTNTSKALLGALIEGVKNINELIKQDMPTAEEQILAYAKEMVGEGAEFTDVTPENREFVRRIYRENSGKGYVAYLVVINERYARIETETLVYVGNNGKISGIKKLIWKTSDAGWGYEPPETALVDAFYASLSGKGITELEELVNLENNNNGLLVTNGTSTSKALLGALIEGVKNINELLKKDMPTSEEQLFALGKEMVADDAEFTDITPGDITFIKKIYREDKGRGYLAYLVVINERYARIETETLVYVGNDGKIKDIKKLIWKTSDAGWGYVPPETALVDAFYASLTGKGVSELEALVNLENNNEGLLVTNGTSTSKALLGALIEGVKAIDAARAKDMPRPEDEMLAFAQQMAGEGATLTNVTPGNVEFLKRLYRIDDTNSYIAYVVVINERYGRVETETLVYVENTVIKDIKKLTWKTSDAGWGYEPPEESLADDFYASLKGKNLAELEELIALESNDDGLLVTNATSTSKALLGALVEAVESAESLNIEIPTPTNNTPRIVGIVVIALLVASVPAVIIIRRRIFR